MSADRPDGERRAGAGTSGAAGDQSGAEPAEPRQAPTPATIRRRRAIASAVGAAVLVAIAALTLVIVDPFGSDEELDAPSFVREANAKGAGLRLGQQLYTNDPTKKVYGLSFNGGAGGEEQGGSLSILADVKAANADKARCERTGALLCFRAQNVTIALPAGVDRARTARLVNALYRLSGRRPPDR